MAKYITRTIETYSTACTFVMDNQINEHTFPGEVGVKKAKKELIDIYGKDIVVVSCKKQVVSQNLYRMLESDFIANAEVIDTSSEV